MCFLLFNIACDEDEVGNGCGDSFCVGVILPEAVNGESDFPTLAAAINLAASDISGAGRQVKVIFRENQGTPDEADRVAEEFLNIGVHGIVGAWSSSVSLSMIDRVTGNEVVMVSPSNTSPSLTEYNEGFLMRRGYIQYPYYYRTTPSDVFVGPLIASTLAADTTQLNSVNMAIIYREDDWGTRLTEEIDKAVKDSASLADKIVGEPVKIPYNPATLDTANVGTLIADIESRVDDNTDVIILLVFDEGDEILRGMIRSDSIPNPDDARYYLGDGYVHEDIDERVSGGDPALEGKTNGIKVVQSTADPCRFPEFISTLKATDPGLTDFSYTSEAYDAVVLLALASLSAGSNEPAEYVSEIIKVSRDGQACTTYQSCAALLTDDNTDNDINYNGISGQIGFDRNGDITSAFYTVFEYDNTVTGSRTLKVVDRDGNTLSPCP